MGYGGSQRMQLKRSDNLDQLGIDGDTSAPLSLPHHLLPARTWKSRSLREQPGNIQGTKMQAYQELVSLCVFLKPGSVQRKYPSRV